MSLFRLQKSWGPDPAFSPILCQVSYPIEGSLHELFFLGRQALDAASEKTERTEETEPTEGTDRGPPPGYSHSMVLGGLEVMSYTTRVMPRTSFTIRLEIRSRTS